MTLVCENCAVPFDPIEATAMVFDGCGQRSYQCPTCGGWEPGPLPC